LQIKLIALALQKWVVAAFLYLREFLCGFTNSRRASRIMAKVSMAFSPRLFSEGICNYKLP
jgi:hypothetical protein